MERIYKHIYQFSCMQNCYFTNKTQRAYSNLNSNIIYQLGLFRLLHLFENLMQDYAKLVKMNIELLREKKNIIKFTDDPLYALDPRGLGVIFMERMKQYSNNTAQIDAETGNVYTYNDLLLNSIRVAQHLLERAISQDDIILTCSYNNMDCVFPLIAGLFLNVRVANLVSSLPKYDIEYLVKLVRPKFIFCDNDAADILFIILKNANIDSEIIVYGKTEKYTLFSHFLQPTGIEMNFKVKPISNLNNTAFIYFSSGTTGYPKGICVTHGTLQIHQEMFRQLCDCSVMLTFSSHYWISALITFITAVLGGTTRIISKMFEVEKAMDILTKYKVTFAFMAQNYTFNLTQKYNAKDYDTTNFKTLFVIGEKVRDEQMIQIRQLFPNTAIINGYGMTEIGGCILGYNTMRDAHFIKNKIGSCGRPVLYLTYKIVHPDTEEILGPNQTGELRLKGPMMNGYYDDPGATRNVFDSDGFFKTGDLFYYDEDYCFYFVDRIKEMLKYQAFIQSPFQLEEILLSHPEIKEAVVVGKPDVADGDHPAAFITLKENSQLTTQQILDYYNEKILNYEPKKLRGGVFIVDVIPRTPTGKVQRKYLRESLASSAVI